MDAIVTDLELKDFDITPERGFLSSFDPAQIQLPAIMAPIRDVAMNLPAILLTGELRRRLLAVPMLDVHAFLAEADDAQRLALDLECAGGELARIQPISLLREVLCLHELLGERQDEHHRVLGHGFLVDALDVAGGDLALGRGFQIQRLETNTKALHDLDLRRGGQDLLVDRLHANDECIGIGDFGQVFIAVESVVTHLDAHTFDIFRNDVFEIGTYAQQVTDLDLALFSHLFAPG